MSAPSKEKNTHSCCSHPPERTYACPMHPELMQSGPGICRRCGMALEMKRIPSKPLSDGAAEYSCPMHPEIVKPGPGICPKCGMSLEPRAATEAGEDPEARSMNRRFWISLVFTLPVFLLSLPEMTGLSIPLPTGQIPFAQAILSAPVVLWGGWPFFERAWQSLVNRSLNMFTLIALGTGAAYFYSLCAAFFPSLVPAGLLAHHAAAPVYFESAAVITTLVLMGQVLELRARARTGEAVRSLMKLSPKTARIVRADGSEEDILIEEIKPGDKLRVRPGESIPADGVVTDGASTVDEAMMTGEPVPEEKMPGSAVSAGTINGTGTLIIEARRVGADTLLSQIIHRVSEAQRSRAPIQKLADRVSSFFVPGVIASAAVTFLIWFFYGPEPRLAYAFVNAVSVLIIACPCALGLATPMSVMVSVGRAAQHGILIRDAEALEQLEKADALVIDKTGTLTIGKPTVSGIFPVEGFTDKEILRLAASLEQGSEHPLAEAVLEAAREKNLELSAVTNFEANPGKGLSGVIDGKAVLLGSYGFLQEKAVSAGDLEKLLEKMTSRTVIFIGINGKLAGLIGASDPVRKNAFEAVSQLRQAGMKVVMATGDNARAAESAAKGLQLDQIFAGVMPAQKAEIVNDLKSKGYFTAMAGDGINDAPALSSADIGIAMGTGTDIAMQSAGIVLVKGDLRGIAQAKHLSRLTLSNIRQNLFFAFFYNFLGIPVAAGLLYPAFGILLNPMIAGAAMSLSSVCVILNSLRLRRVSL